MKRVTVHIDRLVLTGFPRGVRHAIAADLQQELGRVFAERDLVATLTTLGHMPRLRVCGAQFEHGVKPQRAGENVAQSIGKEIRK